MEGMDKNRAKINISEEKEDEASSNLEEFYKGFCDEILRTATRLIGTSNNLTTDPVYVQILKDVPEYNRKNTEIAGKIYENFRKVSVIGRSPLLFTPVQKSQFYSIVHKKDFPCDDTDIFEPFIDSTDRMFAIFNNAIDEIYFNPTNLSEYTGAKSKLLKKEECIAKPQKNFAFKRGNFDSSSEEFDSWCHQNFLFNNTFFKDKSSQYMGIVDSLLAASYLKSPNNLYFKLENLQRHPYLMEILQFGYDYVGMVEFANSNYHFAATYSDEKFCGNDLKFPPPADYVDTPEMLEKLIEILLQTDIIAVDIEAHSTHSYLGIICLIQLTTTTNDYIIDALKLHDYMFSLNKIFSEPKILKVFHGARSDIVWLQRDYNIYVVNFFDTFIAANRFDIANGYSLANLLRAYCNVRHIDKQYQLADWRLRPLTPEMLRYAQMDTHYLLFLFKMLVKELYSANDANSFALLEQVCEQCRRLSLLVFKMPESDEEKIFEKFLRRRTIRSHCTVPHASQLNFCKWLLKWRDEAARNLDESDTWVIPDHLLVLIVENMPADLFSLLMLCKPTIPEIFSNKVITDDILKNIELFANASVTNCDNLLCMSDKSAEPEKTEQGQNVSLLKSYNAIKIDEDNDYIDMSEEATARDNERIVNEGERVKVRIKVQKIDEKFKSKLGSTILPKLYVKNPFDLSKYSRGELNQKFKGAASNDSNSEEKRTFHENVKSLSFNLKKYSKENSTSASIKSKQPPNTPVGAGKKTRGRPRKNPLPDSVKKPN